MEIPIIFIIMSKNSSLECIYFYYKSRYINNRIMYRSYIIVSSVLTALSVIKVGYIVYGKRMVYYVV